MQAQALSRGKRSKARRARDKYADQDEEDRDLAMQLLASSGTPPQPQCTCLKWLQPVQRASASGQLEHYRPPAHSKQ